MNAIFEYMRLNITKVLAMSTAKFLVDFQSLEVTHTYKL